MQQDMALRPFLDPVPRRIHRENTTEEIRSLRDFFDVDLREALFELVHTSPNDPTAKVAAAPLLSSVAALTFSQISSGPNCPICHDDQDGNDELLKRLGGNRHYGRMRLYYQGGILGHLSMDHADSIRRDDRLREVTSCYTYASNMVVNKARRLFEGLQKKHNFKTRWQSGLCHPDEFGHDLNMIGEMLTDRLGRTSLHYWLTGMSRNNADHGYELDGELHALEALHFAPLINKRDILGRSPLHIACQIGWEAAASALLRLGGNPRLKTIYKSLPLHYAAAKGMLKTCELLLAHKDSPDPDEEDCEGNTAMEYAKQKRHPEIVALFARHRNEQENCTPAATPIVIEVTSPDDEEVSVATETSAPKSNMLEEINMRDIIAPWELVTALQQKKLIPPISMPDERSSGSNDTAS